jgi:hypothetical protein
MYNYIVLKNGETNELKLKYINMSEMYNKFKYGDINYKSISFSKKINIKDIFIDKNIFITNIKYKNTNLTPIMQFNNNIINNMIVKNMILPILDNIALINIPNENEIEYNEIEFEYIYYNISEYMNFFCLNYQCIILDSEYFKSKWFILSDKLYKIPITSNKINEIHNNYNNNNKDYYTYRSLNYPYHYLNKLNIISDIDSTNLYMENDNSYSNICNATSEEMITYINYDQIDNNSNNSEIYFIIPRNADLIENITIPYINSIKDIKLKIHYYGKDYIKSINYMEKNNELILDLYFFPLICALDCYKIYLIITIDDFDDRKKFEWYKSNIIYIQSEDRKILAVNGDSIIKKYFSNVLELDYQIIEFKNNNYFENNIIYI